MDMCYDGTLVMPSSYAVMEDDEMSYVEGGKAYSVSAVAKVINTATTVLTAVAGIGLGVGSILWFVKNSVNGLVVASLTKAIKECLIGFGFTVVSSLYSILSSVSEQWTIGYGVAWLIDNKWESGKRKSNGLCFG